MSGVIVYYKKNLQNALKDLFPDVGWDDTKFRITPMMGMCGRKIIFYKYIFLNFLNIYIGYC